MTTNHHQERKSESRTTRLRARLSSAEASSQACSGQPQQDFGELSRTVEDSAAGAIFKVAKEYTMTDGHEFDKLETYEIRVKGILDKKWSDWFDGFSIMQQHPSNETLLTGPVADQATLYGLLSKIRDLGLPLLSVQQIERTPK